MNRDAVLSPDGLYRYDLSRSWDHGADVAFVGLNPSTADASIDDPTIRRCVGFARSWGFGGMRMVNLFAFRATNPEELADAQGAGVDPVQARGTTENDDVLRSVSVCGLVIAAWGAQKIAVARAAEVLPLLGPVHVLGLTAGGQPRHPLYMRATCRPISWAGVT